MPRKMSSQRRGEKPCADSRGSCDVRRQASTRIAATGNVLLLRVVRERHFQAIHQLHRRPT